MKHLKLEIATLKESLSAAQSEVQALASQKQDSDPQPKGNSKRSYAAATGSGESGTSSRASSSHGISSNLEAARPNDHHDRKFNVVVYGIKECPKGTTKHARLESDLNSVVTVLSQADDKIQSQSIKDVYRLGKFNPVAIHPRPILVKFVRVADAASVLSKKGSLNHPHFIKPDLTPQERQRDSILLRERWSLIQAGIPRHDIKIRDSRLYVKKKLHCHVNKTQLMYSSGPSELLSPSANLPQSALSAPDSVSIPHHVNESISIVPSNSIAESTSLVETSPSAQNAATPVVQCDASHTSVQSQSPSCSPLPVSHSDATTSD